MRTSQEIYHRVRWDARFDASRFVLGVEQRGREPKRVPLPSFDPQGEIPWHRVLFFEADGVLVWDRASGLDALDATTPVSETGSEPAPGLARHARILAAPFFEPRTPHAFSDGRWRPAVAAVRNAVPGSALLRVLTWNTLWDRYDRDVIQTAERRPMLLRALRDAEVDVIALQEAEPALVKMLLAEDWVRAEWTAGGDPRSSDVADSGLFLLSRLPVLEAGWHSLARHKALTAVVVQTAAGPVVVAATHLSSDHSADAADLRGDQLARLADGLHTLDDPPVVLVGDFNDDTEAPATHLGMTDAWTHVHGPADQTPTFDPAHNPLAAVSSLTGQAMRLDRVLLTGRLEASDARLVGEVAGGGGLFVSDHFGVAAQILVDSGSETASEADAKTASEADSAAAAALAARITEALPEAVVHIVGSRRTGVHLPGADLDLVAAVPGEPETDRIQRRIADALGGDHRVRQLVAARVPGLRIVAPGLHADLVLAPVGAIPASEAVARRAELGDAVAASLSAVSDAEAIRALRPGPHVREVKAWARARGLDAAPLGGLPGLAWVWMAARTRDLTDFFETWAAHDWRDPIPTPTAPIRDLALHLTPALRDLITEELYNAWETVTSSRDPLPALLAPPPMHQRHRKWAVVGLVAEDIEQRDILEGRVRGRTRSLLSALEEAGVGEVHAWPRAFSVSDTELRTAIGLGRTPPTREQLAEIARPWLRGLSGVRVELVGNGDVPRLA